MTPKQRAKIRSQLSTTSTEGLQHKLNEWLIRCDVLSDQARDDATGAFMHHAVCAVRDLLQEELKSRTQAADSHATLAARHMQWLAKSVCILVGQTNNWVLWTTEGGVRWVFEAKTLKDCITKAMETAP